MTPSLVACCPHCGDTATLAVRDDPARLERMKATAERQKTVCGWRYVVVGLGEAEANPTDVVSQVGTGIDRSVGAMLAERAGNKAAPAEVVEHLNRDLTTGSSPASTQEVPNG